MEKEGVTLHLCNKQMLKKNIQIWSFYILILAVQMNGQTDIRTGRPRNMTQPIMWLPTFPYLFQNISSFFHGARKKSLSYCSQTCHWFITQIKFIFDTNLKKLYIKPTYHKINIKIVISGFQFEKKKINQTLVIFSTIYCPVFLFFSTCH